MHDSAVSRSCLFSVPACFSDFTYPERCWHHSLSICASSIGRPASSSGLVLTCGLSFWLLIEPSQLRVCAGFSGSASTGSEYGRPETGSYALELSNFPRCHGHSKQRLWPHVNHLQRDVAVGSTPCS